MESAKYSLPLRLLHWLIALLVISLLAVGLYMTSLPRENPLRGQLYDLHKSIGVTVLILACIRIFFRLRDHAPPLPIIIPRYERILAHLSHYALYGFLFLMPLSGMILTNSYGFTVHWFGVSLPHLVDIDKARGALADDVHVYAAYALMALLGLHVAGVIKHYLFERLNLLKRMW